MSTLNTLQTSCHQRYPLKKRRETSGGTSRGIEDGKLLEYPVRFPGAADGAAPALQVPLYGPGGDLLVLRQKYTAHGAILFFQKDTALAGKDFGTEGKGRSGLGRSSLEKEMVYFFSMGRVS